MYTECILNGHTIKFGYTPSAKYFRVNEKYYNYCQIPIVSYVRPTSNDKT